MIVVHLMFELFVPQTVFPIFRFKNHAAIKNPPSVDRSKGGRGIGMLPHSAWRKLAGRRACRTPPRRACRVQSRVPMASFPFPCGTCPAARRARRNRRCRIPTEDAPMDGRGWSGVASKVRRIAEKASARAENVNVSFFSKIRTSRRPGLAWRRGTPFRRAWSRCGSP